MSDGSGLQGRQEGSPPQAREEAEGPGAQEKGGAAVDAYLAERAAAQQRKIELSMQRKRGLAPSSDPQDRAMMGVGGQERTDNRYNPFRW